MNNEPITTLQQPQFPDLSKYNSLADFANFEVLINGVAHRFQPNAVSFNDMLDFAAELQSGMILTVNQDTNEMTMIMTKEYALKSKRVKVDLACKLFSVSATDPTIDLDTWMHLMEVVDASGFTQRLETLNKLK